MSSETGAGHDTLPERERILDAAFELFAREGIRPTTLADVAIHADTTEGTVRQLFEEVDDLLLAVLERVDSSFLDAESYMSGAPHSATESLRRLSAGAHVLAERPLHARLRVMVSFESIVRDGAARHYMQERLESVRWWLTHALVEGVRAGEFDPDTDADARAAEMVAFMEGIQIQWLLHPDRIDLVRAYESYFDDLLDQITVPEGT